MKLLIVDDSRAMRTIIKKKVHEIGVVCEFDEASNGIEALEKIKFSKPDLVIADWNMPNMDGHSLLKSIRTQNIQVKIGMLTSQATEKLEKSALEEGALFFLKKPLDEIALKSAIKKVFP